MPCPWWVEFGLHISNARLSFIRYKVMTVGSDIRRHVLLVFTHIYPPSMSNLSRLNEFSFIRVLLEDPFTHSIVLLGTFPSPAGETQAIVRIEKTALNSENPARFLSENGYIQRVELEESTDIVRSHFQC